MISVSLKPIPGIREQNLHVSILGKMSEFSTHSGSKRTIDRLVGKMSELSPHSGSKRIMIGLPSLAIYQCTAYDNLFLSSD